MTDNNQLRTTFGTRAFFIVIFLSAMTACGFTGGTRPFVVEFVPTDVGKPTSRVILDTFEVESDAAVRFMPGNSGTTIGAFSKGDEKTLALSIADSLDAIKWPQATATKDDLAVHVILRRHVLAAGWDMAVLAIVAWAMVDADGEVVHREQFYATIHSKNKMWTLGHLKDLANQAIANRVIASSLVIASARNIDELKPDGNTFASLSEAIQNLPAEFSIPPIIVPGQSSMTWLGRKFNGAPNVVYAGAREGLDWHQYDKTIPINWAERLSL